MFTARLDLKENYARVHSTRITHKAHHSREVPYFLRKKKKVLPNDAKNERKEMN
jgi:hypothetical protein